MKIAIVGTGVSGLVSAHLLHDVLRFNREARGLLEDEEGARARVHVPAVHAVPGPGRAAERLRGSLAVVDVAARVGALPPRRPPGRPRDRARSLCSRSREATPAIPAARADPVYHWRLPVSGPELRLGITSPRHDGERLFDAALSLRRVEIGGCSLARALTRYPVMTTQVVAGIYWQAWRLRRKGVPSFPHPGETAHSPTGRELRRNAA